MNVKIYHITHINNLEGIIKNGVLWSDAKRLENCPECKLIGMPDIKRRRLEKLDVYCHPGTKVGQYVPFYFCPRSVMLYILHMGNHPGINYDGGQEPIVHLQADLEKAIQWANDEHVLWAFSDRNAGAYVASFYNDIGELPKLNWDAIASRNFRDSQIKEGKQAEFLMMDAFPWSLVEYIGVINRGMVQQVQQVLASSGHKPQTGIQHGWYY